MGCNQDTCFLVPRILKNWNCCCVGRITANGLKAGMRLMLAAQEPASVFNSAGGNKIKDAISYHLIGRIGAESFTRYCDPEMLNLP
jgi:hypothetical protein